MKRRFGFSVVLFGILASVAGWGNVPSLQAQEEEAPENLEHSEAEKSAMAEVRKLGGHVMELAQNDPHLEVAFHLADGKVGDDHLKPVAKMPLLVSLNLRGTEITNAGLARLKEAEGLKKLHLEKTQITDEGLAHLANLKNLEYLNLYGTAVTDAGLKHLKELKNLKKLYLWQTKVTDKGVEELKKSLPDVNVIRGLSIAKPEEKKEDEAKKKDEDKKDEDKKDKDKKDKDK